MFGQLSSGYTWSHWTHHHEKTQHNRKQYIITKKWHLRSSGMLYSTDW